MKSCILIFFAEARWEGMCKQMMRLDMILKDCQSCDTLCAPTDAITPKRTLWRQNLEIFSLYFVKGIFWHFGIASSDNCINGKYQQGSPIGIFPLIHEINIHWLAYPGWVSLVMQYGDGNDIVSSFSTIAWRQCQYIVIFALKLWSIFIQSSDF